MTDHIFSHFPTVPWSSEAMFPRLANLALAKLSQAGGAARAGTAATGVALPFAARAWFGASASSSEPAADDATVGSEGSDSDTTTTASPTTGNAASDSGASAAPCRKVFEDSDVPDVDASLPLPFPDYPTALPLVRSDREQLIRRKNNIPDTTLDGDSMAERWAALKANSARHRFTPWEKVAFLHLDSLLPDYLKPSRLSSFKGITPYDYQAWFKRADVPRPRIYFDLALQEPGVDAPLNPLGRVTLELAAAEAPAAAEAMIAYSEGFTHNNRVLASYTGTYLHAAARDHSFIRGGDLRRENGSNSILFRDQKLTGDGPRAALPPGRGAVYLLETQGVMSRTSGSIFEIELKDKLLGHPVGGQAGGVGPGATGQKLPVGRVVAGVGLLDKAALWLNSQPAPETTTAATATTTTTAAAAAGGSESPSSPNAGAAAGAAKTLGDQLSSWGSYLTEKLRPYISVTRPDGAFDGYHHRGGAHGWEKERRVVVTAAGLVLPQDPEKDPYKECYEVLARVPAYVAADGERLEEFRTIVKGLLEEERREGLAGTDTWSKKQARWGKYRAAEEQKNDQDKYFK